MKKIAFFYPSNKRSNVLETTVSELEKSGHHLYFLTTCEKGDLHMELDKMGIRNYSQKTDIRFPLLYYPLHIFRLIKFCKSQQIDIVFSHLQHANFIAVFAQFFMSTRVIAFRHHFKFNKGNFGIPLEVNRNEVLFDKVINRLAREIVLPSSGVLNGMLEYEKVNPKKLQILPYLYDFAQYGEANMEKVEEIKKATPCELRLIMVARLIPFKRHILIFPVVKKLIEEGLDLKMLVLDEGPEKENLQAYINDNGLENSIKMIGFQRNVIDYMKAADLMIHPSLTEASNNTVKEIGLMEKVVAVCKGVGDFDDYLVDGENGFLMDIVHPEKSAEEIIRKVYGQKELIGSIGSQLKKSILEKFGNRAALKEEYLQLINRS